MVLLYGDTYEGLSWLLIDIGEPSLLQATTFLRQVALLHRKEIKMILGVNKPESKTAGNIAPQFPFHASALNSYPGFPHNDMWPESTSYKIDKIKNKIFPQVVLIRRS